MEWPIKNHDGSFKTTPTAMEVWVESMKVVSSSDGDEWRSQVRKVKNWRDDYMDIVESQCAIMLKSDPETAVQMAEAGLEALHSKMTFRIDENNTISVKEAFERNFDTKLETETFMSSKSVAPYKLPICSPKHDCLTGDSASSQLVAWSDYGCMEVSASQWASAVCQLEDVSALVKDKVFVLLGITSEMGPAKSLLQIPGAHVMGIARPGNRLDALIDWYKEHGAGSTVLQFPKGGADMLEQGPHIAKWIVNTIPRNKEIIIGHLAYMDGEAHVRITVAMDLISQYVMTHCVLTRSL